MASGNDKKFAAFIKGELVKNRAEDKPLKRFVLRTYAAGTKGQEIESFDLDEGIMVDDADQFAEQISTRAQIDADGNGPTMQRYCVLAYVKGNAAPSARFVFRLKGETDIDLDDESGEEAPTTKGLLAQLMRHNEAIMRLALQGSTAHTNIMTRQMEATNRTNEHLLDERTKMFAALEEAKSTEHVRTMDLMLTTGEQERKDKALEKMMSLVPLVVNRLVGVKVMPGKDDPLMMLLEPLISSLKPEQFSAIAQQLDPQQQLTFVEILRTFQARAQTKEN